MHDGSITFSTTLDNEQLEKDLAGLTKKIEKQERKIADLSSKRDKAKEKGLFDMAALDAEKAKLQEIKGRLAEIRALSKDKSYSIGQREEYAAQIPAVQQELKDQQTRVNALQSEWNKTENAVDRYSAQLSEAEGVLERQKAEAGELVQQIEEANGGAAQMARAAEKSVSAMARLTERIKKLASRVFVFTMITKALRAVRDITMKYIKTNDEARAAIAQLKGALLTLAQPLIEVIIPAFTLLVEILTRVIAVAANLFSALFGKTAKQSKDGAKALYKEANAISGVGEAAQEAAGSLAGFDEINTVGTENAKSAGGGGGFESEIAPDFDFMPGKYKDIIDELLVYLSGALLVIGAILVFSGANIPLGLGLMVLGAAVLASEIKENWGAIDGKVRDAVNRMLIILGGALLVIGAILVFSHANVPLGLGLMILGAAMLVTAVTLNWNSLGEEVQAALTALLQIVGAMIAVIGVVLAVTGHLALGIGLIIAGIALFAAGEAAGEDGDFLENIQTKLSDALEIIGGFLAVVGILLIVTGNFLAGLALLIAGIAVFEYSEAQDDDGVAMKEKIKNVLKKTLEAVAPMIAIVGLLLLATGKFLIGLALLIAGIAIFEYSEVRDDGGMSMREKITTVLKNTLKIASTFLLVLGLILLLVPTQHALGIALIAAGAVGLVTVAALDSDAMKNKLKEMWQGIKSWWNSDVKKFLTLDYWKQKGRGIIDGFLSGLKKAWDAVTSWAIGVVDWFTGLFGGAKKSVNDLKNTSMQASSSVTPRAAARAIPEIAASDIPALARGAVIPPNREFMAVLGDQRSGNNLEAPEDLIRKIVREESGGGNAELVQLLQAILRAIKDGHIIMVDGSVFGRTAIKTINSVTTSAGKQLLLI